MVRREPVTRIQVANATRISRRMVAQVALNGVLTRRFPAKVAGVTAAGVMVSISSLVGTATPASASAFECWNSPVWPIRECSDVQGDGHWIERLDGTVTTGSMQACGYWKISIDRHSGTSQSTQGYRCYQHGSHDNEPHYRFKTDVHLAADTYRICTAFDVDGTGFWGWSCFAVG